MRKKFKRRQRAVDGAGSPDGVDTMKFTAPTPCTSGLEDVFFTWGTAKDAAKFEDTVSKLARHVGTYEPAVAPILGGIEGDVRPSKSQSLRSLRFQQESAGPTRAARSRPTA